MGSHSGAHRTHPGQVTQHLLYNPKSDTKLSSTTEVPILHFPSPPGSKPDTEALSELYWWDPGKTSAAREKHKQAFRRNAELGTHLRRSLFLDPDLERRGELSEKLWYSQWVFSRKIHPPWQLFTGIINTSSDVFIKKKKKKSLQIEHSVSFNFRSMKNLSKTGKH